MKKDGHTHSEYCPHGEIDDTEALVAAAVAAGFTHYAITEHSPMPEEFFARLPGELGAESRGGVMALSDLEHYLRKAHRLKDKYRDRIQVLVGLELEFAEDFSPWLRDLLQEYGNQLDDGLVSVHYLPVPDGRLVPLDYTWEMTRDLLLPQLGGLEGFEAAYYRAVLASALADLGPRAPRRLGHPSLCRKFLGDWPEEDRGLSPEIQAEIAALLDAAAPRGFAIDFNVAGLHASYGRFYPGSWVATQAARRGMSLCYGSDSHHLSHVGRDYEVFEGWKPGV